MRKNLFHARVVCAALAGMWLFAAASADTWIFAGQSNMSCRLIGPAFEEELARVRPDVTITRDCVQKNGSSMRGEWLPGKDKYNDLMSAINNAGSDLTGIVWYQGESEAGPDGRAAFRDNMEIFFNAIRQAAGDDNLPIIVVQLSNAGGYKYEISWAVVRELQRRLAEDVRVSVVASIDGRRYTRDGCPYRCDPDGYDTQHITEESKEMVGVRAARAALDLVYKEAVTLPPRLKRAYRTGADNRRIVLEFTRVGEGLSIGPGDSEIHILAGRAFEQWVPEDDEEMRLSDFQVLAAGVELADDSTIVVTLESGVGGPLVCSYANTAGGMESILLNLGIAVGKEPSPAFLADVEETSHIVWHRIRPVKRLDHETLVSARYLLSGRKLATNRRDWQAAGVQVLHPGLAVENMPAFLSIHSVDVTKIRRCR